MDETEHPEGVITLIDVRAAKEPRNSRRNGRNPGFRRSPWLIGCAKVHQLAPVVAPRAFVADELSL
jgi:hypothetical protein